MGKTKNRFSDLAAESAALVPYVQAISSALAKGANWDEITKRLELLDIHLTPGREKASLIVATDIVERCRGRGVPLPQRDLPCRAA
ncbi:hypothetical protein [Ferrimicrobium acidiphilum]|uniref:hypothetical protein n=1 Tax=Ferrimicrobium acidiphilum TaxID=121039 RepID=UPI0023F3EED2|nr:hypothetical protein [Ferrimicrobium acidiphilum]